MRRSWVWEISTAQECLPGERKARLAAVARMQEMSAMGKDTTIGHWEISRGSSPRRSPAHLSPAGFRRKSSQRIPHSGPGSGRAVQPALFRHRRSSAPTARSTWKPGKLIVYTSADSVFQIAAHEALVPPPEQLYGLLPRRPSVSCTGKHGCGARHRPALRRRARRRASPARQDRHDFSLEPPGKTLLDARGRTRAWTVYRRRQDLRHFCRHAASPKR